MNVMEEEARRTWNFAFNTINKDLGKIIKMIRETDNNISLYRALPSPDNVELPNYNDALLEVNDHLLVDYVPSGYEDLDLIYKDVIIKIVDFPQGMIDWIVVNPEEIANNEEICGGLEDPKEAFKEFINVRWTNGSKITEQTGGK